MAEVLALATGNLWRTGTIALAIATAGLGWWAHHEGARAEAATASLAIQAAQFAQAQHDATAAATAARQAQEARNTARKETSDAALALDSSGDHDRADAYAAAHSLRSACAAQGGGGSADLPGPRPAPQVADRSGPAPELDDVVVTHPDFDICTVNSRRLQNAHDWGLSQ